MRAFIVHKPGKSLETEGLLAWSRKHGQLQRRRAICASSMPLPATQAQERCCAVCCEIFPDFCIKSDCDH